MWDGSHWKALYVCSEYIILLVKTIPTRFCWLSCRKQKLVQSKTLQQGLFFWDQTFDSVDIPISAEVSDCKTTIKKRTDSSCVFTLSGKVWKDGEC